jgi:hypothetical protein
MCSATFTAKGSLSMPPQEDARAIFQLALRHDLARLQLLARARLPEETFWTSRTLP